MSFMVVATVVTAAWLRLDTSAVSKAKLPPWLDKCEVCLMVPVICSMDAAVSSKLLA